MFSKLPLEVREQIFSYCSVKDLKKLCCTNSEYNDLLKDRIFQVVKITGSEFYPPRSGFWKVVCGYYNFLQSLMERRVSRKIRKLRQTKSLIIYAPDDDVSIPKSISAAVATLNQLVELHWHTGRQGSMFGGIYTNLDLLQLCNGLMSIKKFSYVIGLNIGYEGMMAIGKLITLQELELSNVTGEFISHLSNLTGLKKLSARDYCSFTGVDSVHFPVLEELNLKLRPLAVEDLLCIGRFVTLRELKLKLTLEHTPTVYHDVIPYLNNLINLETLYLICGYGKITDVGISHLQAFVKLQELMLSKCRITDVGLHCIAQLSNLTFLDLKLEDWDNMGAIDMGILRIADLPNLKWLNLGNCNTVSDSTIFYLESLDKLQELEITNYQC